MEMYVVKRDGSTEPLDIEKIHRASRYAANNDEAMAMEIEVQAGLLFYPGITTTEIQNALTVAASRIDSFAASRLLMMTIYKQVVNKGMTYPHLAKTIAKGVSAGRYVPELLTKFDLDKLHETVVPSRDDFFDYLGLMTLEDRYMVRALPEKGQARGQLIELPQHMLMRIAMGLALNEKDPTARAIEFYEVLSKLDYLASTPTLFNSGTPHSQLSSCYGNTVSDDLVLKYGIFDKITESASLSKWAGGVGTDWNQVRGENSVIKSTNGVSAGVVPYLKIYNDTAVAVNQGGKRKGAFAPYMEPWHIDALRFIDLRKPAGEERFRTPDINPAWWMNDLLIERKDDPEAIWSFFCPSEVPHLHELYGEDFRRAYEDAEKAGLAKKTMLAKDWWRRCITSLHDTGYPWITFKDEMNRRNPQHHDGVIHNTNLCTEIALNNKPEETFVCNLGSINLAKHLRLTQDPRTNASYWVLDRQKLCRTVRTAMRMLDNVIDLNFYPSEESKRSNMRHRPVGLGVMGYTEAMAALGIKFASEEHLDFADHLFEQISYDAIKMSCELAQERGAYQSFPGSTWSRGILTIDTARDKSHSVYTDYEWQELREDVKNYGVRNCCMLAIAPTATIANIAGTTECVQLPIEASYEKENLGGLFTITDPRLKYRKAEELEYAFDVDQVWSIRAAGRRQKWLDQAQSLNLYRRKEIKGSVLSEWYTLACREGLKSTYYLKNEKTKGDAKRAGEKGEAK